MKILLVEDDLEFAELIEDFLSSRSIETYTVDDPFKAMILDLNKFDLLLLDLGLPGVDGIELCKKIRTKSKIPIIISSARNSVSDKVLGLQLGADDYLPKPYDPDELYARIVSLIRRTKEFSDKEIATKKFIVDKGSRDVLYLDNPLNLTEAEFEVFSELIKNYGSVVSKEQLLNSSLAITSNDGKTLEVVISKIRHKVKRFSDKKHIVSLRGRGYRIVK